MKAIATFLRWFFLISNFVIIICIGSTESRYLKSAENINELSYENAKALDDDVDLENVVEDYYDDLWHYLEIASDLGSEKKSKEKFKTEDNRDKQLNLADYDYMSDMAVPEPTNDEKKFKTIMKDSTVSDKENLTYVSDPALNGSNRDFQIPDIVRANRESNSEEEFAQRNKEMRLKSIISQVLSIRGGTPKPNETIPDIKHFNALKDIYEKNMKRIKTDDWTASYTEKAQSFYPSCVVPRNTDEDVWSDSFSMNLLFELDFPNPQEDSTVMIVSAKLRLYKLAQENYSSSNTETISKTKTERNPGGIPVLPGDDDRQIRVSVYWYTRSLRRHRVKKKLLDSQMLSMYRPKWAEFNIRAAVRTWKDSGRNFGLVVTVEDEDGILLPADQYIQSMNCSKWTATVRPIPSIIMDKAHQYHVENLLENDNETEEDVRFDEEKRKIYPYEPLPFPIIDLRTREVPISEVKNLALVNSAKIALESKFPNLSRRELNLSNNSITIFLKNYSLVSREAMNQSKFDRSVNRKHETRTGGDSRVSYFQNVPIGSPSTNSNRNILMSVLKKNHGGLDESEEKKLKSDFSAAGKFEGEKEEEREKPRIRHSRRQWEMAQKTANLNSRLRNDFNGTDHH